ncbi:hypothetical protein BHE74_00007043 [Ensete ventricosum]|nr:hypothetical protein BHE74_00007043 [Ensete ventricosum]
MLVSCQLLLALAASQKSHHTDVSQHIAKCDAKRLYEARHCSTGGTDESVVLEIFSKRSIPQLRLALFSYKQIYGHDYTKALKKDTSGEFEEALRIAIKCVHNPAQYYSRVGASLLGLLIDISAHISLSIDVLQMVNKSIKMGGSDARVLTRVMLGSTDAGMKEVRSAFEKMYGRKMQDAICDSLPDGDYRDFIVALSNTP